MSESGVQVLVVAAHPDDELLGVGGTIARHVAAGDRVAILIVALGLASRGEPVTQADFEALRDCARRASRVLGAEPPRFLDFPDNAMDSVPLLEVVRRIEDVMQSVRPRVVYTHHPGDLNVDHQAVCRSVMTACRPLPGSLVEAIHGFETASSTEWSIAMPFVPTHFVDISGVLEKKMEALAHYASELRPSPHPRSAEAIRSLATWRGATAGLAAAEAFAPLRTRWLA